VDHRDVSISDLVLRCVGYGSQIHLNHQFYLEAGRG
jgi:hypothetical protein